MNLSIWDIFLTLVLSPILVGLGQIMAIVFAFIFIILVYVLLDFLSHRSKDK